MSIADHFGREPDAGFVRAYDAGAAKRQFQVSIVLVLVLALAALALALLTPLGRPLSGARSPAAQASDRPAAEGFFDARGRG